MSRKTLLITDEAEAGQRYRRMLEAVRCDVEFHEDLAMGIRAAGVGGFGAVLVSQTASGWDPLDVFRQAKAADPMAQVVIISRQATVAAAVAAMREGVVDYLLEPCSETELRAVLARLEQADFRPLPIVAKPRSSHDPLVFEGMLGGCLVMQDVFSLISRIAPADATVLVTGESGTGKEMVAQAIHRLSRRRDHPFLGCDCTALATTLLESELFGHVRGSFSGAIATKKGLFEAAHQGTLMLDEVANLSMETQGKLLRVLETRQIRKVGDTTEHDVDIRLVATTNRSLADMVKVGAFRADLYYRLNVVPVTLPPLRDRVGDIPLLADVFLARFSQQMGLEMKGFSPEAAEQMQVYAWPGNVRELRNIVERLSVLYGGTAIQLHQLPSEIRDARTTTTAAEVPRTWEEFKNLKRRVVEDLESRFLSAALERCSQNITQAAESVGMQRTNFHALLRHHHMRTDSGRRR
jgi:DNA-binding NtrC family response regulator